MDAEDAEGLYRVELCTTDRFYWPSSLQSHRRSGRYLQALAHLRGVASGLQRAPGSASGENVFRRGRAQLGGWVLRHLAFYLGAWKCGFICTHHSQCSIPKAKNWVFQSGKKGTWLIDASTSITKSCVHFGMCEMPSVFTVLVGRWILVGFYTQHPEASNFGHHLLNDVSAAMWFMCIVVHSAYTVYMQLTYLTIVCGSVDYAKCFLSWLCRSACTCTLKNV